MGSLGNKNFFIPPVPKLCGELKHYYFLFSMFLFAW